MFESIQGILSNFRVWDAIDIAIVAYLIYKILGFINETRAQQLVRGLLILVAAFFVSDFLDLYLLNWLLKSLVAMGLFAIVVLFQPELRRALETVGRKTFVGDQFKNIDKSHAIEIVNNIVEAVEEFSATRTGALIVIERDSMMNEIIETGVVVNAEISVRLLGNLFYEGSPLHDGAVIIRGDKIYAASCVLPLTEKRNLGKNLGTRHRAGVGLSEISDALVIIVSEETGVISVAENGQLARFVDTKTIEKMLLEIYLPQKKSVPKITRNLFTSEKKEGGRK
jgi:diadenylate cyclase